MRACGVFICLLLSLASAQQPTAASKPSLSPSLSDSIDPKLNEIFQTKIKTEWDALKRKDKNAYADLLAEDYQGVEADGRGERNRIQAINEVAETNVYNYSMFGFKVIPLPPDAALVIYEITMEFPPKSQVRYSRVYISALWLKRGAEWKEVHYQETVVK